MVKKAEAKETTKQEALVPTRPLFPAMPFDREIDRLFDEFRRSMWPELWRPARAGLFSTLDMGVPSVDVYEEDDAVIVKAELPGLQREDVEIGLTESSLTIRGEKKREEETKEKDYYRSERQYGSFVRTVQLPAEVQSEKATAKFKDGVLQITLPKAEAAKRRSFRVPID
jgi:HSP20 family protein